MIDRSHEFGLLVNALDRCVADRVPQLVNVFGNAGVGKSRLLRELSRHAAHRPDRAVAWYVGHCRPYGENVTYAALADDGQGQGGACWTPTTSRPRTGACVRRCGALFDGPEAAGWPRRCARWSACRPPRWTCSAPG